MLDIYLSMSLRRKNYAGPSKGPRVPNSFHLIRVVSSDEACRLCSGSHENLLCSQGGNWKRNGTLPLQALSQR